MRSSIGKITSWLRIFQLLLTIYNPFDTNNDIAKLVNANVVPINWCIACLNWRRHLIICLNSIHIGEKRKKPNICADLKFVALWQMILQLCTSFIEGQAERQDKHTWPPVFTPLYFDISHVIFVCFMSSLLCVHAVTESSQCA